MKSDHLARAGAFCKNCGGSGQLMDEHGDAGGDVPCWQCYGSGIEHPLDEMTRCEGLILRWGFVLVGIGSAFLAWAVLA